jgi:hypothetical protein
MATLTAQHELELTSIRRAFRKNGSKVWSPLFSTYLTEGTSIKSSDPLSRSCLSRRCALVNNPVRTGEDVKAFLQNSFDVTNAINTAVEKAILHRPISDRELAKKVLDDLIFDIPQQRLRLTGFPLLAGPTLLSHIAAVRAGTFPSG